MRILHDPGILVRKNQVLLGSYLLTPDQSRIKRRLSSELFIPVNTLDYPQTRNRGSSPEPAKFPVYFVFNES